MDQLAIAGLSFILRDPTIISTVVSLIAIGVAIWVYLKKINLSEYTSVGNLQAKQTKLLMDQITQLTKDLQDARKELRDLFDQNLVLMKRITELEDLLGKK